MFRPVCMEQVPELLSACRERKVLPVGKRRTYGDASLNTNFKSIDLTLLDHALEFDPEKGVLIAEAGITLDDILRIVVPHGWFLPVTPGTRYPTLGGSLAVNVHGKNHHMAGTLIRHVKWFDLLTASGDILRCSPESHRELFYATAGGLGLTGIVAKICLQLQKVSSAWIVSESHKVYSLAEMMELLECHDSEWPYTVAWVECFATGRTEGRGEVLLGRHAELNDLTNTQRSKPFEIPEKRTVRVPFPTPVPCVNPVTSPLFNEFYFASSEIRGKCSELTPYRQYFYPLDSVRKWNYLYGTPGFLQYQFVVPFDNGEKVIRSIIRHCRAAGHVSALAVLKRMGDQDPYLSFPMPGWTMALDFPVRRGLFSLLNRFDRIIVKNGGRIYLAKDSRIYPGAFRRMYPEWEEWKTIKKEYDPQEMFTSDLARRLEIVD